MIRSFSTSAIRRSDFSHTVVGGGIVGLAIAAELLKIPSNNVCLIEKNQFVGMETSSRNSEVIHAGIYYPIDSLKASLCIKGKQKIYDAGSTSSFPVAFKKCGKLIVGQSEQDEQYLNKLYETSKQLEVPIEYVAKKQIATNWPLLKGSTFLSSPSTGIISAHDFLLYFQSIIEKNNGTIGISTEVSNIDFDKSSLTYTLYCDDTIGESSFEITSDNLINAGGLYAPKIANMILPPERHFKSYFAKGNYFSYAAPSSISVSKITNQLVYPVPNKNAASLGTHLTFDMAGQIRFGPDLEWLDVDDADKIDYTPNDNNIHQAYDAIKSYFPSVTPDSLSPSYSGVRPKLASKEDSKKRFSDFYIKHEADFPGFVNLIGIESPGLTASWGIADYVVDLYHK
jgi:L-2-hydroxyglutarate oxidase LhgO